MLGFGTRPVRLKAPSTVRPTGPLVSPPPAAETLVAFDASRERAADAAPVHDAAPESPGTGAEVLAGATTPFIDALHEPATVVAPTTVPEPVTPIEVAAAPVALLAVRAPAPEEPLPIAEPVPIVETPAVPSIEPGIAAPVASPLTSTAAPPIASPVTSPVAAPVLDVDTAESSPPADPVDPPPLPFAPQRRSSSRTFALAAAIAAAVIVIGATLWPAPRTTPDPKPTAGATTTPRPSTPPSTPALAGAPSSVMTSAATTPAPGGPVPVDKPAEPVVATTQPAVRSDTTSALQPPTPEPVAPPAPDFAPVGAAVVAPVVKPSPPAVTKPAPAVVRKPDAAPVRPVVVATATPKSVKAEPHKPSTAPAACTRSTCGSVVSVRAIDDVAARDYEVIVRLDDRSIRAVRMPARWSPGARVRVVGSRFEPVGDR